MRGARARSKSSESEGLSDGAHSEDCSHKSCAECSQKSDSFSDVHEALAHVEFGNWPTTEAPGGDTVPKPKALFKFGCPPKAPFARQAKR